MEKHFIKFGLFTDLHYANRPTDQERYYESGIEKLKKCYTIFEQKQVDFVVCLGDLIDHPNNTMASKKELEEVMQIIQHYPFDFHLVLGNHDIDTLTRDELFKIGNLNPFPYYSFDIMNYHFIILDSNYNQEGEPFGVGECTWDDTYINQEQIDWLKQDLNSHKNQEIILFIHSNLDPFYSNNLLDPHVIKNAEEIRHLLRTHDKSVTVFQGHYHPGKYQIVDNIAYHTLQSNVTFKQGYICKTIEITHDHKLIIIDYIEENKLHEDVKKEK